MYMVENSPKLPPLYDGCSFPTGKHTMDRTTRQRRQDRKAQADNELRLLYGWCVSEIASFKQQQWSTTNYALVAYAALASVPRLITIPLWGRWLLVVVALIILAAGVCVTCQTDKAIKERRDRMGRVRDLHFTPEFHTARGCKQDKSLKWLFVGAYSIGFVVTACLLLLHT